ncbi:MAG: DNA polymerase III subunit alpha [Bacteroidales bacterium]
MTEFTHLHVHTNFSILDGAARIDVMMKKVADSGMKALAITDHGNMYGVMHFTSSAKKHGVKPIVGCEVYVAEGSRFDKKGKEDRSGYHLILLAKNRKGYENLSRICSIGYLEGYYYTPRIDKEVLAKYSEGIIASSACLGGEIPQALMNEGMKKAEEVLQEYLMIFKDDFYLELQRHGLKEQEPVNQQLLQLAKQYNVKVIATNDCHYINAEDSKAHDILICLQTGRDLDDPTRMRYSGQEYVKTPQEMAQLFHDVPEALANTQDIVDKVEEYNIMREILLPIFPLPEGFDNEDDYLKHLTWEGARKFYPEITTEVQERLDYELKIIKDMGFAGYFLIVQDFINEARKMGVAVGPGRGSAAGSAVAFCTGITSIDPIRYSLLFERFLNPERVSMPDIDIDFDDEGREKVMDYVINKYGQSRVAQIVTFGTMAAKSSIRDVARVLRLPLPEADRLAKLVPEKPGTSLDQAYKEVPELSQALDDPNPLVRETLKFAKILEGSNRQTGVHACGVIIGPTDLIDCIPLSTQKDSILPVTQYDGKYVESVGMLKMDFLGLKTLSIIKEAVRNIKLRHGIEIDPEQIPLEDEPTFKLYQRGDTVGTFQFESDGMRKYLKELKPTNIEDLIAMNALYRPGPMDFIPDFINRKQGIDKTEYPHPWLEEILTPTYGIMVYQEQIMQAAQIMAGYSLGAADILRRAMGKKKKEEMDRQQSIFVEGATQKGVDKKNAEEIFNVMARFAEYGFNRSHSAAYSVVAYRTAYLKANYPAEYMAAVLTNNFSDIKKISIFMEECQRQNIPVLGPDINESAFNFIVNEKGEIRFGLGAIKGVGEGAVESIVQERDENGPYKSIFDFMQRINLRSVNKRVLESLAMAGAFDCYEGTHRAQFFYAEEEGGATFIDKLIRYTNSVANQKNSSQMNLFGDAEETVIPDPEMPDCPRWDKLEMLKKEKEVTGMYISGHPLDNFRIQIESYCSHSIADLQELDKLRNREISFAGVIVGSQHKYTKTGKPFGSFTLEDYTDSIQLMLFSEDYLKVKYFLEKDNFVYVKASIQPRFNSSDQLEVKVKSMMLLSDLADKRASDLVLDIPISDVDEQFLEDLMTSINRYSGSCRLKIRLRDEIEKNSVEMLSRKIKVDPIGLLQHLLKKHDIQYKLN